MKQLLHVFPCLFLLSFLTFNLHAQYAAVEFAGNPASEYSPTSGINALSAAPANKKINLEWSVPVYAQASTYIIERSLDGEHFEVIGSDATAMSDAAKKSFTFSDKPANKAFQQRDIFYRVGTLTGNNEYLYTKPLMVRMNHTGNVDFITVLPNPIDNNINMIIGVKENSYVVARITNEMGQEIMNRKGKIIAGRQEFTLAGTNCLAPGTYWLEVMVNRKSALTMKLLKD